MGEIGKIEFPPSTIDDKKEFSRLERLIAALKTREAYSPATIQTEGAVDYYPLSEREQKFIRKFLDFEIPIPAGVMPDYIIVPSTSKLIDKERYGEKITKAVELSSQYPEAKIIFSGKMPAPERRTGKEMVMPSEAEQMAEDAEKEGIDPLKIIKEKESGHIKENIAFCLKMIRNEIGQSNKKVELVIANSKSILRRCYYTTMKLLETEFKDIADKVKLYFVAAGDDLDRRVKYYNEQGEVVDEGGYFSYYEARRLLEYRKKDWL